MKYEVQHLLPAAFDPKAGDADRPALIPGAIVTEQQVKDYGHDLGRLLIPRHPGFGAALVAVKGSEDALPPSQAEVPPTQFDAAEPVTGGAVDNLPKPETVDNGQAKK